MDKVEAFFSILIGRTWNDARRLAQTYEKTLMNPIVSAPPRTKVLLGQYRVIGYRRVEDEWCVIIAAEQESAR